MSTESSDANNSRPSACSIATGWSAKASDPSNETPLFPPAMPLDERVRLVFEKVINPELAADGGSVEFSGLDSDRVVQIRMKGSCQGCASSAIRLSMILECTVKKYVPEVKFLEVVI